MRTAGCKLAKRELVKREEAGPNHLRDDQDRLRFGKARNLVDEIHPRSPLEDQSSESASGPVIISSATLSVLPRMAASNLSQISGFSFR